MVKGYVRVGLWSEFFLFLVVKCRLFCFGCWVVVVREIGEGVIYGFIVVIKVDLDY